jgi:hypothetical protein
VFADIADIRVFPLMDPHVLQLGTIGSHAMINYGTDITLDIPGTDKQIYIDIVNFDCYNMIIGTPFMNENKVHLDFEKSQVTVNGVMMPTTHVALDVANRRLCWYCSIDKQCE